MALYVELQHTSRLHSATQCLVFGAASAVVRLTRHVKGPIGEVQKTNTCVAVTICVCIMTSLAVCTAHQTVLGGCGTHGGDVCTGFS